VYAKLLFENTKNTGLLIHTGVYEGQQGMGRKIVDGPTLLESWGEDDIFVTAVFKAAPTTRDLPPLPALLAVRPFREFWVLRTQPTLDELGIAIVNEVGRKRRPPRTI
jgi:hypothetical protein